MATHPICEKPAAYAAPQVRLSLYRKCTHASAPWISEYASILLQSVSRIYVNKLCRCGLVSALQVMQKRQIPKIHQRHKRDTNPTKATSHLWPNLRWCEESEPERPTWRQTSRNQSKALSSLTRPYPIMPTSLEIVSKFIQRLETTQTMLNSRIEDKIILLTSQHSKFVEFFRITHRHSV